MLSSVRHVAGHVLRRSVDSPPTYQNEYDLPPWTGWLILANIAIFVPLWLFISYTISLVLPTLAMIEDENPPAYEPLATGPSFGDDDTAVNNPLNKNKNNNIINTNTNTNSIEESQHHSTRTVTSSLRHTVRILKGQTRGPGAYLRGFPAYLFTSFAITFFQGFFALMLPGSLALLAGAAATLLLVQYNAVWVHVVITPRSPLPFWRRLPSFSRAFAATWRPTLLVLVADVVGAMAPIMVLSTCDMSSMPDSGMPETSSVVKGLVLGLAIGFQIFVSIPANIVLTRIQASLLPVDQDTVVPFDRTFGGRVEPELLTGKGWASVMDAWNSLTRTSWRRIVLMYGKIALVSIMAWFLTIAVIAPQVILVVSNATKHVGDDVPDVAFA